MTDLASVLASQPHRIVERDGVRYTLLGTAHVSRASVDAVRDAIASDAFDSVAVELDAGRLQALTDPDALVRLDLVKVIREGKVSMFAANLALAAYQRRLAEQLGVEPGAELKAAVLDAREKSLPVHLIDREVGLTFRRAMAALGWWGRIKVSTGIMAAMFSDEKVEDDDIEKLKHGDMLESSFGEFESASPALYETIIAERDRYMAARLRELPAEQVDSAGNGPREVLAVVGAGHLAGLASHLENASEAPAGLRAQLEYVKPKKKIPWFSLGLLTIILCGIGYGIHRGGIGVGAELLGLYALYTGGLAALGCLLAGGHPLSILTAAAVAPFKPFRLNIPTGAFAALVEARLRKPAYGDFLSLRDDVQSLRGVYRNRVARVVLVFTLTNLGSMTGLWLAGLRIFGKLAQ